MATTDLTGASSVIDHPAAVAAEYRLAAGRYTAAASDAAGRGDDVRAADYTARAERNQAAADEMSEADVAAHAAASYVRPARRLIAAGVKRGTGPLVTTPVMSQADRERHTARCYALWAAATNFRRYAQAVA